jgi:arylsulfatase A-like enzyme
MLSVDELVGAVVETITELGQLSNTFIFFTCVRYSSVRILVVI